MKDYESQARLFKALMHPARLAILNILRDGEACVCHLEAALGYRQAYISQQLMVLREAGLVEDRRQGWNIYYHVTRPQVFTVMEAARQAVSHTQPASNHAFTPAARLDNCPCPHCVPASEKVAY